MSGKSDAKRITWYADLCSKLLDEVAELKQRIAELEAQQLPKTVTPVNGKCPACGGVCGWGYCCHCGAKLNWVNLQTTKRR